MSLDLVSVNAAELHRLQASIVYIPDITAEPASSLRQRAYLEGNLVPSPADDPLGWVAKPQVLITGSLYYSFVGLECTVSTS